MLKDAADYLKRRSRGIVGSPRKKGNTEAPTAHALKAISEEGLDTELILRG
jgi:multimeric flavodoxin WrbA